MAREEHPTQGKPLHWPRITRELYEIVAPRFPVVKELDRSDRYSPFSVFSELTSWINALPESAITPSLMKRIRILDAWCMAQPRGETAENDLFTIYIVGFFEDLFASSTGRLIVRQLTTKQNLLDNEEYLRQWVGNGEYEEVLALFEDKCPKTRSRHRK